MRPMASRGIAECDVMESALFPMVPYANRIRDNGFCFQGQHYRVEPNVPGQEFNLHGSGWRRAWTVTDISVDTALLSLCYQNESDGYYYTAHQQYRLTPRALSVETQVENTGPRPMPFGLGHHPYWPRTPRTSLQFNATHLWLEGSDHMATDRTLVPPAFDYSLGRRLPDAWRNNLYEGWDGVADIRFGDRGVGLRISADPIFRYLMLYGDPAQTFFCLEPQTHTVGALNCLTDVSASDLGLVVLASGEQLHGSVVYMPYSL